MLNKITIIGHLGADPEFIKLSNSTEACNFSVATNEKYKDKDGEMNEITTWHDVATYGKLALVCHRNLAKGSKVYVEGPLRSSTYTPIGTKINVKTVQIKADKVIFLSKKRDNVVEPSVSSASPSPSAPWEDSNDGPNDDLPF